MISEGAPSAIKGFLQSRQSFLSLFFHNTKNRKQHNTHIMNPRPATEALEGSARIPFCRTMPPLAMAKLSSSSLKSEMPALFNATVSMQQQQDSMQFPVIAWSSDDDENERSDKEYRTSLDNPGNSDLSYNAEEKDVPRSICKLTTKQRDPKRRRQDSGGVYQMVRSKALYSELSLMVPCNSPGQSSVEHPLFQTFPDGINHVAEQSNPDTAQHRCPAGVNYADQNFWHC